MSSRTFWLDLFTGTTWKQFLDAGGEVSGFRPSRKKIVQRIKIGDYLLCYLTGVSRFVGVLEVTSEPFEDDSPIWPDEDFPCRLKVTKVFQLTPETAVPIQQLKDELSFFKDLTSPNAWTGRVRSSPAKWETSDGVAVFNAIQEASENPIKRPVDPAKLARRPRALKSKLGSVTIPESNTDHETSNLGKQPTVHDEIQWLLLKLGNEMGLDVWVARNDRSREFHGHRFSSLPRIINELPLQFDEATNRTIEHIDVLWLSGKAIVAAFEIESTTSVYSGLLRMSDLLASARPEIHFALRS